MEAQKEKVKQAVATEDFDVANLPNDAIVTPVLHSNSVVRAETASDRTRNSLTLLTNICFVTGIITPIAMFLFFATHNSGFDFLPVILVCAIISFCGFFTGAVMSIVLLLRFLFACFNVSDVARQFRLRCLLGILVSLVPVACGMFIFYVW